MKDKWLQIKVTEPFKNRTKKGADHYNVNLSQFVIMCINKELERIEGLKQ